MTQHDLIQEIDAFIAENGLNPTKFGKLAMNDPTFVFGLREGRDVRFSTAERVRAFMRGYSKQEVMN